MLDYEVKSAYPLHLACWNVDCPNEVIQLLLERLGDSAAEQLTHMCYTKFDYGGTDIGEGNSFGGLPLHFYLSRISNVDLNTVKELVSSDNVLQSSDEDNLECTPIHILIHNEKLGDMFDVLQYLAETNPSSLRKTDIYNQSPLYVACEQSYINTKTIELLLRVCPDSIRQPNNIDWLPIHSLCEGGVDDEVAVDILRLLLEAHSDSTSVQGSCDGELPLHLAASNKAPAFCKLLVDAYPEAVKWPNNSGHLPFHCATKRRRNNGADIIKFLLLQDPECLSKPVVSDNRGNDYMQGNGALPLHLSCNDMEQSRDISHLLFDLYPEAILIRNEQGQLPVDVIRQKLDDPDTVDDSEFQRGQELVSFLYTQMGYATKAQNKNAMRTRDCTGSLPLHQAIRSRAPLGSIKLLVKGNPNALNVPDGSGAHPLEIACQSSTVGIVKYLAERSDDGRLHTYDGDKNFQLHHACRGGNCEVISYLLERPMSSATVSERNVDDKLPIHLFCEFVKGRWCEGETPEYTETIWRLLTAYPETVLNW